MKRLLVLAAGIVMSTQVSAQWAATTNVASKTVMYTQGRIFGGGTAGVYISDDDGTTWTQSNTGLTFLDAKVRVVIGDTVYLEATDNVWKSHYNNINWVTSSTGLPAGQTLSYLYKGATTMYATYQTGNIYTSTNNGNNWTLKGNVGSYVVSIQEFDNALYACTNGAGILKSTDGGVNWTAFNTGIPSGNMVIFSFAVYNNELYAGTYSGKIYKLPAGGSTWALSFTHAAIRDLYAVGNTLMAGTDNGFIYTHDGVNWSIDNAGLSGNGLYVFNIGASNQNLFLGGFNGGVQKRSLSDVGIVTTSVASSAKQTTVEIYPNPTIDILNITGAMQGNIYTITDLSGREVIKGSLKRGDNAVIVQTLTPGMYIIYISGSDMNTTMKFIKQ